MSPPSSAETKLATTVLPLLDIANAEPNACCPEEPVKLASPSWVQLPRRKLKIDTMPAEESAPGAPTASVLPL
eukprot:CAMPEP_0119138866 /NCGR_PEP_ID=MMETSP1310-20130426/26494_1 /TAXON_ID=464262 /ORGANISM="Genus nov. species nov., Strain RCC2339" /LENGTH=72 /DNA_ID=CAMNT_0007130101 /DNA_START=61 /DNA_END=276 /DNA_ORIENTATION=+